MTRGRMPAVRRPLSSRAPLLAVLLLVIAACGAPTPPEPPTPKPPPSAGARVLITSPAANSAVSGAVYFAVQLLDPADIATLELRVDGEKVTPQFPGETPLRVFLIPRDYPEGPLQLSARVGSGSNVVETKVTVNVVHRPPSSATVGTNGALLGTTEENGGVSTVVIPGGLVTGASVEFESMTQAEVKAATGVDYDALGVTFLGAQELRSSQPTGDGVNITSGNFGPMVQPGQTVVNYRITGDMGRGVGELMVVNGAAVAPNGDIVSNRPVEPQLTGASATNALRAESIGPLQTTLPAGPPGSQLEFTGNGLNIYATFGYAVRFTKGAQEVEVPAVVGLNGDGRHYVISYVPDLAPGTATVELVATASDTVIGAYTMNVTASPSVSDPKALVDAALASASADLTDAAADFAELGVTVDVAPLQNALATARAYWAGRPADDPELVALARMIAGSGADLDLRGPDKALPRPMQTSALCMLQARKYTFDKDFSAKAFKGDRFETGLRGLQARLSLGFLDRFADRLEDSEYECDPYKEVLCQEYGIGCENNEEDDFGIPDDDSPNYPRPRPAPPVPGGGPLDWTTGMGSLTLSGGPLAGSARRGSGGSNLRGGADLAAVDTLEPGRYSVRILANGTTPWPFATYVAPDGYFYIPALPGGVTSTMVLTDHETFAECLLDVEGSALASATVLYVDLDECMSEPIDPEEYSIVWIGTAASGNWNTASNWDLGRVPNADDDVLIPSSTTTVRLSAGDYNVRSIRSLGTLEVNSGATVNLNASGNIDLNWLKLTFNNAASTFQAGGALKVDRLWLGGGNTYALPSTFTTFKEVHLDSASAVLTFSHTLTITEHFDFSGTLAGTGRTVLAQGATAKLSAFILGGAYAAALSDSHVFEVRGSAGWGMNDGALQLNGTSRVEVKPTGVLDLNTTGARISGNSNDGTLVNEGTIRVTTAGEHTMTTIVFNEGTMDVSAGAILTTRSRAFTNSGTITGGGTFFTDRFGATDPTFTHQAGAVLNVDTLRIGSKSDGSSTVIQGTIDVNNLEIQNGLVTLAQDLDLENLLVHYNQNTTASARLVNSGTIEVSDRIVLGSGYLGGTGTTILEAGGTLDMSIVRYRGLEDSHRLVNYGTATWGPQNVLTEFALGSNTVLENHGEFFVQNDRQMKGGGTFHNHGVLHKQVATGTSTWDVCLIEEPASAVIEETGHFAFTGTCG